MITDEQQRGVDLWVELEKDLLFAKRILSLSVETRPGIRRYANSKRSNEGDETRKRFPFRGDENSQKLLRRHMKSGTATLQRIYEKIEEVEYDDELTMLFGRLFFDIGFLVANAELPSADAAVVEFRKRFAGKPSADDKRAWVARQLIPRLNAMGNRALAERNLVEEICALIKSGGSEGYPPRWYETLLTDFHKGQKPTALWVLKATYGGKELGNKTLEAWAAKDKWPLPPDLPFQPA